MWPENEKNWQDNLTHFTGSESLMRWTPITRSVLSEGAHYVASKGGAFWLFDAIDSHLTTTGLNHKTEFTVARLTVTDGKAELVLDDGNGQVWARQSIEYTDFELPEFKTYAVWNGTSWTHMLPSEY